MEQKVSGRQIQQTERKAVAQEVADENFKTL